MRNKLEHIRVWIRNHEGPILCSAVLILFVLSQFDARLRWPSIWVSIVSLFYLLWQDNQHLF